MYSYSCIISFFSVSETYGLMMATLVQPKHVDVWIYYNNELCVDGLYSY
jgi:hypothetical protein